jgi:threonine efflux protein
LPKPGRRSFIRGFLTNLSNPKAVIYFGSVFSLFVGDDVGAGARWGLFLLIVAETFVVVQPSGRGVCAYRQCAGATSAWRNGSTDWPAGIVHRLSALHLIFTR